MNEYLVNALKASREAQKALHAAYEQNTMDRVVWEAFQTQVKTTAKLKNALVASIVAE